MHCNSSICHIPEWKIQGDISIGKDLARSLSENLKSIKPSLSYGFILSLENILKIYYSKESYHFKNGSGQIPFVWACSLLQRLEQSLGLDPNFTEVKARIVHESVCIHPRLGGGAAFLSTTNCMHKKFCLDESKPGRNTSGDLSLKISDCFNKWCLWKKLGALPTPQETEFPCSDSCTASPCTWEAPPLLCDSVSPSCKTVRLTLHRRHIVRAP